MKKNIILCALSLAHALYAAQGTVLTDGFHSTLVPDSPTNLEQGCYSQPRKVQPDGRRLFNVYLPPNYDQTDTEKRYPTVYWCIGFNGNNESATNNNLQGIIDTYINNGQIMPMIVIFPDPSLDLTYRFPDPFCGFPPGPCKLPGFPTDYSSYGNSFYKNSALNNVMYEDYFIEELIPYVDANYNTIPDRNFRAITGHSMGGYGALYLGMKHPETFATLAAMSPTAPYTFTNNEVFTPPTPYPAYTLNSIFIGGILKNSNLVTPCNEGLLQDVGFQDFIFALAGALSPNTTGGTPFLDEYQVDLPIYVNPDGTASLIDGIFEVVDFLTFPPQTTTVDKSVVLDQSVIDIWHQNDPYYLIDSYCDTLAKQAIYLDGGNEEPWNNIASRQQSDLMMACTVDNEFFNYCGKHADHLFDAARSRNTTVFKMLSGQFAAAGTISSEISTKLMGNLTIELYDNSQIIIDEGSILSIQTSNRIPDSMNPIAETDVALKLHDTSAIHIGSATQAGGALQVGDPFTKALLQTYNTGPATPLASHNVNFSLILDDCNTLFEIGREGFFGIGMGIHGKSNSNVPNAPQVANFWSVTSLANVQNARIILNRGTFSHQAIASGDEEPASLFGLDLCDHYDFFINPEGARVLGGGNIICTVQDPINNPSCTLGNIGSQHVNRQIRILHPTLLNIANELPRKAFPFILSNAAGIVNKGDFRPDTLDLYYDNPISSSTAYTNIIKRGILQSTPQFNRGDTPTPFEISTDNLDDLCAFLSEKQYEIQPVKLANISPTPETKLAYLQNASFIDGFAPFESQLISRPEKTQFEPVAQNIPPYDDILRQAVAGIQLAYNGTKADIPAENITNVKELVRVYDAHSSL